MPVPGLILRLIQSPVPAICNASWRSSHSTCWLRIDFSILACDELISQRHSEYSIKPCSSGVAFEYERCVVTLMGGIYDFLMTLKVPSLQRIKGQSALACGQYHIINVERSEYLGISNIGPDTYPWPGPPASVAVLHNPFFPPEFTIVPVDIGANAYAILIEKRVTGDHGNRVFAFSNEPAEVWLIRYKEAQDAYTIEKREEFGQDLFLGWTAPPADGAEHPDQILLRPFSEPRHSQLFKIVLLPVE
ncbi:hypothetical protein EDD16DRAFT_1637353 [Pisolithus croceorrhizus]|nr:hypothetical protein EDD16DRAFT_1637353 [Pisolithus croceorrhizus]KAI6139253.1 hypothetical protein EDD17DRAFT_1672235 [Pisolithus thermaeus]